MASRWKACDHWQHCRSHHPPDFRVRAALFDHTIRDALAPPHTSRRWDRQLRAKPETEIRELR